MAPPTVDPRRTGRASLIVNSVIARPLLSRMAELAGRRRSERLAVVIDVKLDHAEGREAARARVVALLRALPRRGRAARSGAGDGWRWIGEQFLLARLTPTEIRWLVSEDAGLRRNSPARTKAGLPPVAPAIHRLWPDFAIGPTLTRSTATVKADAAARSFSAMGDGIVWAVIDSGIDARHPHFAMGTLALGPGMPHRDFTGEAADEATGRAMALTDPFDHGSHVAGILAGGLSAREAQARGLTIQAERQEINPHSGQAETAMITLPATEQTGIWGVAPRARLLSLRVLDRHGHGQMSAVIAALDYVQKLNGHGRRIRVHGVNLSVGYNFDPEWFACGQSPLCVEVDRLVRSGVVVVASAGNTGFGHLDSSARAGAAAGLTVTINDPGNAQDAITVGATHRDMPHIYGVSYFSSKGPTGDGRHKPDLVAPGERILSCAANRATENSPDGGGPAIYREDSGTSMAAPHVSGCIAAFLSIRPEFIGRPERVKSLFMASATDLGRDPTFQGRGLIDLMRAIQSV